VTNGPAFVMSGAPLRARWLVFAAAVSAVQTLDALDTLRVARAARLALPAWKVWLNGFSSVGVLILVYPLLQWACEETQPWRNSWLRIAAVHAAGAAIFTVVHVLGLSLVRVAAYPLWGERYAWGGPQAILNEAPRDAAIYAVLCALIWFFQWREIASLSPAPVVDAPASFDIRDGARVIRAPVASILAVRSAGNYVEFLLADGRRPLMRATMAAVAGALEAHGFTRTHRTWIVNRARVEGLAPAGSGDVAVTLSGGVQALLSRRYREAAELLATP
jgi:hypothetical protein